MSKINLKHSITYKAINLALSRM